jgi:molecular chaperone DnaK (HSP70)
MTPWLAMMQRIHMAAISAVHQSNLNTQAQIHVPYISLDMETRQPQHLDVVISRSTIERLVQEDVVVTIYLHLGPV